MKRWFLSLAFVLVACSSQAEVAIQSSTVAPDQPRPGQAGQRQGVRVESNNGLPDPTRRFEYIREYTRAMRAIAATPVTDLKRSQEIQKYGAAVMFLTQWDDAFMEQRRDMLNTLLEQAKKEKAPER